MKNSVTSIFQLPAIRSSVRHSAETLSQRSYPFSKLSVSQTIRHQQLAAETIALVDIEFEKFASHVQPEIVDILSYLLTYLLFYSFNPSTWGHSPKDIEHVKNSYHIYKRQNI